MGQRLVRPGTWQSFSPIRREGTRHTFASFVNLLYEVMSTSCVPVLCG